MRWISGFIAGTCRGYSFGDHVRSVRVTTHAATAHAIAFESFLQEFDVTVPALMMDLVELGREHTEHL